MLPQDAYGTHPRRFLALSVTNRCTHRCRHCWERVDPSQRERECPFGDFVRFVRGARAADPDFHVQITGGEPLLREDDVLSIVRELSYDGIYTHLSTNGVLISGDLPERLADAGLSSVAVSMDGFGHDHDWLRDGRDAYLRALGGLEQLGRVADRVRVSVATLLFKRNLGDIGAFIDDVLQQPFVSHVNVQVVFPSLESRPDARFYDDSELWPKDVARAERAIDSIAALKRAGRRIKNPLSQLEAMKAYLRNPRKLFRGSCNVETEMLHVAYNGDVRVCTYTDEPIGNIQFASYSEMTASDRWAAHLREIRRCRINCHMMVNCAYSER